MMDSSTAARLNALNLDFYRRYAAEFDGKRRNPWPGWETVIRRLEADGRRSILDVGCGNGRFARFAQQRLGRIDYTGVDGSRELLALAAREGHSDWRLLELDLLSDELPRGGDRGFDLVTCFGVMHHLPGRAGRRRLLDGMIDRARPGGLIAVSFWQFGNRRRFEKRFRDWAPYGFASGPPGSGDHLLAWGEPRADARAGDESPVRYCHFADREEAREMVDESAAGLADEFLSDGAGGDLNLYFLLERPAD